MKEECGVAAVYALKNGRPDTGRDVSQLIPRMLLDMQVRGELSAGITSYDPSRRRILATHKRLGTVHEAFRLAIPARVAQIFARCRGCAAIGHVRYATCGQDDRAYAQPFERTHGRRFKWFSFAFNGQLANYAALKDRLRQQKDYHIILDTDTEIIMHTIARELMGESKPPMQKVFTSLSRDFDGAYSLVLLTATGDLAVVRDPRGIKPLCYAATDVLFGAASESTALSNLGFKDVLSLQPGCFVLINENGVQVQRFAEMPRQSTCFFEWVYFAHAGSTIDNVSVYLARHRLGKALAETHGPPSGDDLVVVPVPDTAKAAADGMGYYLGVPVLEGLLRNRYVGRTFIKGSTRAQAVAMKYTPVREVLEGKRVILVEDSIVRGTTLKHLVHHMRERGRPREIHLRIASPPILYPCFYGIDMSTVSELFARGYVAHIDDVIPDATLDTMAGDFGVESLRYLPRSAIPPAIGLPPEALCMACIDGQYPTPHGVHLHEMAELAHTRGETQRRTYERPCEREQPSVDRVRD